MSLKSSCGRQPLRWVPTVPDYKHSCFYVTSSFSVWAEFSDLPQRTECGRCDGMSVLQKHDIHFWWFLALLFELLTLREVAMFMKNPMDGCLSGINTLWGVRLIHYKKFYSDNNSVCRQILQLMKSWNSTATLPTLWQ